MVLRPDSTHSLVSPDTRYRTKCALDLTCSDLRSSSATPRANAIALADQNNPEGRRSPSIQHKIDVWFATHLCHMCE
ncbi:MAG: hypothetical protein PUP91_35915 [Rhizonema sp. PD37]|nr:hypothetical protein [Rhizonema sp. PD37]